MTQVYQGDLIQGWVHSGMLTNIVAQTWHYTGTLSLLTPGDLADTTLSISLVLEYSLEPGIWHRGGVFEWSGSNLNPPSVTWSGIARQVRLSFCPSRPTNIAATITQNQ